MKTILKVVGVLIILIIAALFILPVIFKDDIVKLAKQETNKVVNAEVDFGDINLSLIKSFPDFFLSMEDLKVKGVGQFNDVTLAELGELDLVIDLMSVIKGETIQLKRIALVDANIHLKVMADGKANWDIAKSDSTATKEVEKEPTEEGAPFKMELQEISIVNANFVYQDLSMPMSMGMHGLNASITGDMSASETNLDALVTIDDTDFSFDGADYLNDARAELKAGLGMNLDEFKFTFLENTLRVNELPLAFDGWVAMPNDAIDMDITYAASETAFKEFLSMIPAEFSKDLEGVQTSGTLALDGYVKGTYIDSTYPAFALNLQVADGMFKYPDLPKSVTEININTKIESADGDLDHTIIDVSKFAFNMAGNPFSLTLYMSEPISDPFIRSSMQGKIIIDNVKDVIPLEEGDELAGIIDAKLNLEGRLSTLEREEYESFKATGDLEVSGLHYKSDSLDYPVDVDHAKMTFTPAFAELSDLNMKVGKSDFQAKGRLENFIGYALSDNAILHGQLDLNSQLMDINELAGIDPEEEESESKGGEGNGGNAENPEGSEEPMEALLLPKNIDFTTTADIKKLIYDDLTIENIGGSIVLNEEKLNMKNTKMDLLEGSMLMNGFYESTDSLRPTFDFAMDIDKFDVQKTSEKFVSIQQMAPIIKHSKGKYSTKLTIAGALDNGMNPIYDSFNGKGKLKTHSVKVEGFKPLKKVSKAIKYDKLDPLDVNDVNLTFNIVGGKVFVEPFDLKVDDSKVTISGYNSIDQTMYYTLDFEIPRKELGGEANSALDGLLSQAASKGVDVNVADNINIGVIVEGDVSDPKIKTDFSAAKENAKKAIEDQAKKMLEEKKKELERQAREEAEKKKKELEEKAKKELEKQKKEAQKKLEEEAKKKLKGLFK